MGWISNPEGSHWQHGKTVAVVHKKDDVGLDNISIEIRRPYSSYDGYSKSFNNLGELLQWAEKKNFTAEHIETFLKEYYKKKI